MKWKFFNTGHHSGVFNMEFDEALACSVKEDPSVSILRVYAWTPYAISIGFNQTMEDFDQAEVTTAGFDIVRRPTGGKAIFHAHELTYSVVTAIGESNPRTIYRWINEALGRGLHRLGIETEFSTSDPNFQALYRDSASIPCFSSSAKSELQHQGKKIIGSAQRRYGSVVLQHGSFLLGPQHQQIVNFLASHVRDSKDSIEHQLRSHTIDAETILGRPVSFTEAAEAIKNGFEDHSAITFEESSVDDILFIPSLQLL